MVVYEIKIKGREMECFVRFKRVQSKVAERINARESVDIGLKNEMWRKNIEIGKFQVHADENETGKEDVQQSTLPGFGTSGVGTGEDRNVVCGNCCGSV